VTLTEKDQKRVLVLSRLDRGEMTVAQAAHVLACSARQVQRIHAAYRTEGAAALPHGNRGRRPANALEDMTRDRVLTLAQSVYGGINHQHLTELLAEREGICLSCSTVKRILSAGGIRSPKTRRGRTHRARRERYAQAGMLLQIDGSRHAWLGERGPWLCLVAAIDDATSEVAAACFREQEDAQGYLLLLGQLLERAGRPVAVYHDRHGIFERAKGVKQTIDEELAGIEATTQVERALEELAITSIAAQSPQAKGRIERLFGTLQDRLVTELRLAGISSLAEANAFLPGFLVRFNQQFRVPAAQKGSAYRPLAADMMVPDILCFKYRRIVTADNVVRFGGERLQLLPSHGRMSYAKAAVTVHERLDGSLAVYYQQHCLLATEAPPEAPQLRARAGQARPVRQRQQATQATAKQDPVMAGTQQPSPSSQQTPGQRWKPPPNHPWRNRPSHQRGDTIAER
jgi:transposase